MVQLVWKFLFCVLAIIASSQICECKVSSFPPGDEEIFPEQMTEDDIETAELLNEVWDSRPRSDSFTIRDFEEEEGALPEEGDGRSKRSMPTLSSICSYDKEDMYRCPAEELENVIEEAKKENRYYYIGYTGKGDSTYYIKNTGPKSGPNNGNWKERFHREGMYYAEIDGTNVTEEKLIEDHINDPNGLCTNCPTARMISKDTGIVYVVIGQPATGKDEGFDPAAILSDSKIWARSRPFRDVLDKIEYLLRLNRFE